MSLSRRTMLASALGAAAASAQSPPSSPKLGLIGLGNRPQRHLAGLAELPGVEISALCDIQADRMRAARKGQAANAAMYVDYRELLADSNVQAVTIAAPNYLHAEMAIAAMEAGKDVLMEKPIGLNYAEGQRVLEAARRTGRIVAVGMQRHYASDQRVMREFVQQGGLGTLWQVVLNEFRGDWNPKTWQWTDPESGEKTPWRFRRELAGSSLLEFSVHNYGLMQQMIGGAELQTCAATGGALHWPERTTEDVINVIAEYGNGVRVAHAYNGFSPGAAWNLTLVGDRGSLQWDRRTATVRLEGEKPFDLDLKKYETGESDEAALYRDFFESVRTREPHPLGPEFAIAATKLAWAAWVSIDHARFATSADFPA
ncbi:MAG: hypothetical protein GC160_11875 [Acidobacteria bacterium]|nr:hypothetical protein [Acidobacteriota bacterium]